MDNSIGSTDERLTDTECSELIKRKREELNLTQKEFANFVGLTKNGDQTIHQWERGKTRPSNQEIMTIINLSENPPFKNPETSQYTMIDLFSGIGGTRLGFQLHGNTRSVFSSEMDKFAVKTYKANFGEEPAGDITKIDEVNVPDHDILVGGFPCQAFSQAGLRKGFEDTRGTLFFDIARILKEKKPKAFLLENVKNLLGHDKGNTFKVIHNTLLELGYYVFYTTLKAKDFGLPQNRERIYIVGFDKEQVPTGELFNFPQPTYESTKVGDILEEDVDDKYTISDKLWEGHKRRKKAHIQKGNGFGYSLFNENSEYTNTMSARYYKDGSEILIEQGQDKNPRKITPREASRLQGFPGEFIIPVSDTQAYKQFGNSVAVPVIYAIAEEMFKILEI